MKRIIAKVFVCFYTSRPLTRIFRERVALALLIVAITLGTAAQTNYPKTISHISFLKFR